MQTILFVWNIVVVVFFSFASILFRFYLSHSFDVIAHPFVNCVRLVCMCCLVELSWVLLILSHIRWVSIPNHPLAKKAEKNGKNSTKPAPSTDDYLCATIYVLASIYVDYVWKANEFACFDPFVIHFSPATYGSITQSRTERGKKHNMRTLNIISCKTNRNFTYPIFMWNERVNVRARAFGIISSLSSFEIRICACFLQLLEKWFFVSLLAAACRVCLCAKWCRFDATLVSFYWLFLASASLRSPNKSDIHSRNACINKLN